ncbi:MAG: glycosyltransferase [Bacteroidota bacterium]
MTGAGEERIASLLLQHLPAHYAVELVLFNGPIDYPLPEGQALTLLRRGSTFRAFRLLSLPLLAYRYYRFCQQEHIDISLSFDTLPNIINCCLGWGGWAGRIWLREVNYVSRRFAGSHWSHRLHRYLLRRFYPYAHRLFVNARRIGSDLVQHYGISLSAVQLMTNPLDMELIAQSSAVPLEHRAAFVFIHVGAFRPQKNHRLLLEAFAQVEGEGVELWLVGKGPLEAAAKMLAKQYGIEERVRFWGFQSNPFRLMAAADCMVLSSNFEGLPNVLLEGLACGLPLIATDCPSGPREVLAPATDYHKQLETGIEKARHGLLVPVGDANQLAKAMQKMLKSTHWRQELRARASDRIAEFQVQRIISNFISQLELEE